MSHRITYKVGCDPELFLVGEDGKFKSAHNVVAGEKFAPFAVRDGAIQPDGTAAEFNIDPATTAVKFSANIRSVLNSLQDHVSAASNGQMHLRVIPTAWFDPEYFKKLPPEALQFGCMPDFDAWSGNKNVFKPTNHPYRTGGGHIHIGWTDGEALEDATHLYDCQQAVRQLDAVLYVVSHLWDRDQQRRALYGKIGAYRPKSFGVEYRPLSNAWVADPDLHIWVFNAAVKAMQILDEDDIRLWELQKDLGTVYDLVEDAKAGIDAPKRNDVFKAYTELLAYDIPELPAAYTVPF
jgi:hypothetical protein